jgi:hypothetical protein
MTLPGLVRANNLNDVVDRERAWDNLGSSLATGDIAIPAPSLDLNFAANKSLVDDISGNNLITFTRASTGTFVGSNGLIQTAASGVPRFDHNPTTGESLGLLVEEARTNINTNSGSLSDYNIFGVTRTLNSGISPDGQQNATLITLNSANSLHYLDKFNISNFSGSGRFSVYAKFNGLRYLNFFCNIYQNCYGIFDLVNGVAASGFGTITPAGNGWFRLTSNSYPVGNTNNTFRISAAYDMSGTTGTAFVGPTFTGDGVSGVYLYGMQSEAGAFPTSYIPTTTATVTRAADVASMTGTNFSSWYNQGAGSIYADYSLQNIVTPYSMAFTDGSNPFSLINSVVFAYNSSYMAIANASVVQYDRLFAINLGRKKQILSYTSNNVNSAIDGVLGTVDTSATMPTVDRLVFTGNTIGTIARLTYWPTRLYDQALQYITQSSITAINLYAFNYVVNGKDVLALNAVRNASTRDFIFIKGLLSAAQPRLTAAAATTSSGLTLVANALPKLAPSSNGNYFFASGLTLSGVTTRINGTNALSIATSPFSGSTATAPLLFRELRPQANWRFTEPMPSGTIASPEFVIPFETNDFVLFMKAGPN